MASRSRQPEEGGQKKHRREEGGGGRTGEGGRETKTGRGREGGGGVFTFDCTAWWRVYIYYVWLCLASREYWLLDLTLRE